MERFLPIIVEHWWFIAILGVFTIVVGAPFFAFAIKAFGMSEEMKKQRIYSDHPMVRCVIDHPFHVVAAMGIAQIIAAVSIGIFT